MSETSTEPARPWRDLAHRAFRASMRGDDEVAAKLVERIHAEHDAVIPAMVVWLDTLLVDGFGETEFGPAGVVFGRSEEPLRFADGTQPPEVVWSGRLFAARAAGDEETFNALIAAVTGPDSTEEIWGTHVLWLLHCAATTYRTVTEEPAVQS
jgi:hypothetical protein